MPFVFASRSSGGTLLRIIAVAGENVAAVATPAPIGPAANVAVIAATKPRRARRLMRRGCIRSPDDDGIRADESIATMRLRSESRHGPIAPRGRYGGPVHRRSRRRWGGGPETAG